jgi:hypothetical protein
VWQAYVVALTVVLALLPRECAEDVDTQEDGVLLGDAAQMANGASQFTVVLRSPSTSTPHQASLNHCGQYRNAVCAFCWYDRSGHHWRCCSGE